MITINMEKARNIHREKIRVAREPLLLSLDVEFQRALETSTDTSDIVAKKKLLRDAPNDPSIEVAKTTDALKRMWPDFLGKSPYELT